MKIIRKSTFETNSSSTHSLTMCIKSDFDKWKNGEMVLYADEELVLKEEYDREIEKLRQEYIERHPDFDKNNEDDVEQLKEYLYYENEYKTYDEWEDDEYFETYIEYYTTPNGEEVVSFGKYGYDC